MFVKLREKSCKNDVGNRYDIKIGFPEDREADSCITLYKRNFGNNLNIKIEALEHPCAARMTKLTKCLCFNLTNTFTGNVEFFAYVL